MSVYKQVRKSYLKQINKKQKKQLKGYIQDVADDMLICYAETIRIGCTLFGKGSRWMPIDETGKSIRISIEIDEL